MSDDGTQGGKKRRRCKPRGSSISRGPGSDGSGMVLLPDLYEPGASRYTKLGSRTAQSFSGSKNDPFVPTVPYHLHTQIFRRLFDLTDPYNGEIMTGCPVINLRDSSAQFIHLLMTLYQPSYFRDFSYSFDLISAILRRSTKYRIRNLRSSAINKLKLGFPSTLESFDDSTHTLARDHGMSVITVTNLARDTECFELLPFPARCTTALAFQRERFSRVTDCICCRG